MNASLKVSLMVVLMVLLISAVVVVFACRSSEKTLAYVAAGFIVFLVIAIIVCCVFLSTDREYGKKCAHDGCNNTAVSTGDSIYCAVHSNNCLNCGCYIDGDAMYCMSCIESALS